MGRAGQAWHARPVHGTFRFCLTRYPLHHYRRQRCVHEQNQRRQPSVRLLISRYGLGARADVEDEVHGEWCWLGLE